MFWPVRLNWRNSVLIFHFDPLVKLVRSARFALRGAGSFFKICLEEPYMVHGSYMIRIKCSALRKLFCNCFVLCFFSL